LGRKNTYFIFFGLGALLYASIPFFAQAVSVSPSIMWLVLFYAATMLIFTMYGGAFATIPAYLADIFGTKFVGGIHGRLLTAWSTAGVLGPLAITSLRESSTANAINNLVEKLDPAVFQTTFGAGIDQLDTLVQTKTVTISKLMEIAPTGTIDPTPSLYNQTMYLMASLLIVAFIANFFMRPVHTSHHMEK
ncbi:MAG TPA: MFS transporter, partial [Methylophaga sp.]|nr:MFS transporter [Methylophaga sp.]